jgi:hypothetical protein
MLTQMMPEVTNKVALPLSGSPPLKINQPIRQALKIFGNAGNRKRYETINNDMGIFRTLGTAKLTPRTPCGLDDVKTQDSNGFSSMAQTEYSSCPGSA